MSFHTFVSIALIGAGIAASAWGDDDNSGNQGNGKGNGSAVTITRDFLFPPVTLTSTETARVIVANTAPAPTTGNGTAPSCAGTISFITSGNTQPTITKDYTIGSDKFAVSDLQFGSSGITGPPGEVIGKVVTKTSVPPAPCTLSMSLVVFDTTTGAAHVVLTGASSSFNGVPPGLIGR